MSRVIQCELILPITAKFIRVCTMYVQCIPRQLAWFWHGSWRIVCTEMNTIFGVTFVGHWFVEVFCSLRSHGTRDEAGSIIDKGYRERLAWKRSANRAWSWEGRGVLSGVNKLTTANLCDRKKTPMWARWYYDSSMSLRNSRLVFRRLYLVSPIIPCPVW